jgi:hypothetical protein
MLSSDHLEPGPSRRRKKGRGAAKARPGNARDARARAPFNLHEPWDAESAEALTRLYESDEGQLHKPFAGDRARHAGAQAQMSPALEQHLSDLAERLEGSLARLSPAASFADLNGRLEAIEERFGQALERVAQRAEGQDLRAIEVHVLNLADHLERTRERLEQIGSLEAQVRGLSQRLDAADQQQLGALGKLLRDYVGEWRESEQRTASALHSLEEAIHRLGDTMDAMEASKPAPDLSLPTFAASEPARDRITGDPLSAAGSDRPLAPKSFHSLLDAADYTAKAAANDWATPFDAKAGLRPDTPIAWSAADDGHDDLAGGEAGHRVSRITSLRARLRQAQVPRGEARHDDSSHLLPGTDRDAPGSVTARRTRPRLLLIAGVAFLAGGAYLLAHALTATTTTPSRPSPARTEPGAKPAGAQPDFADPTRAANDAGTAS